MAGKALSSVWEERPPLGVVQRAVALSKRTLIFHSAF